MRVAVIGTGVAGLCAATALAERGVQVVLIGQGPDDSAASWLAGGMLAPVCEGEAAPPSVVLRGAGALDWWAARVPGVVRAGTLVVAPPRDGTELDRFARITKGHRPVDPGTLEPDLAGRFRQGLFFPDEGHLDPRAALAGLVARLAEMGVVAHDGPPPPGVRIIDARGLAMRDRLPGLRAVRGEMAIIATGDITLSRPVRLLHPRFPCYIVPRGDGRFMVGATMVETDRDGPATVRAVVELLSAAFTLHPAFAEAELIETGAGLRPALPDNTPALIEQDGRIHIAGLYRHGFLMAPALASELAARLTNAPEKRFAHAD